MKAPKLKLPSGETTQLQSPYNPGTLQEWRRSFCNTPTQKEITTFWPCPNCCAKGWIYNPNDPPDPVEGNKLRLRIQCPECQGKKSVTRERVAKLWREKKEIYEVHLDQLQKDAKKLQRALNKLSKEEWELLVKHQGL